MHAAAATRRPSRVQLQETYRCLSSARSASMDPGKSIGVKVYAFPTVHVRMWSTFVLPIVFA